MKTPSRSPLHHHGRIWSGLLGIAVLLVFGCAAEHPTIVLSNPSVHRQVRQEFTRAYATRDGAGEYQVILVSNPIDDLPMPAPGEVIQPSAVSSIHQILQVRMLWRPIHGTKPDFAAATNSVLHWYVFGPPTADGQPALLHYAGTGFVDVYSDGSKVDVDVRTGNLKLIDRRGDLNDPVGACSVNGKFKAVVDDQRVADALDEIKTEGQAAPGPRETAQARPGDGPPPRGTAP